MIKKSTLHKIAKLLKIETSVVDAAIADEKEVELELPDVEILTKDELTQRDKNKYDTGKAAGAGMTIAALAKKHGVEAPGDDAEKFVENLTAKVKKDANANPDERIVELNKQLETTKKHLQTATEKSEQLTRDNDSFKADTKLLALLPADRIETMSNAEYLTLVKNAIRIENKDGKEIVHKNGEPVLNPKTGDPIAAQEAVRGYFAERKWVKEGTPGPTPGRGGGNSNPGSGAVGKIKSMSELKAKATAEGIDLKGSKGSAFIAAAIKDNPDINMNA